MKKKILVIGEDADLLEVMAEILSSEGFEAFSTSVPGTVEMLLRQNQIDLVIIDHLLRGINEIDVCHQIKCCPEFARLPVIIYSAYPRVEASTNGHDCDVFIAKPFGLTDFLDQVFKLLT